MYFFNFPFKIDSNGRNVVVEDLEHIHQSIEQLLFTSPGERLNYPTFGCGLDRFVFERNDSEIVLSSKSLVQSSLQRWLGNLIEVESLNIQNKDSTLAVSITYRLKSTNEILRATFQREATLL